MLKELHWTDKQMDHFAKSDLDKLITERKGPCVSFYLPMERRGLATKCNSIRFRNLLDEAVARLNSLGLREAALHDLIAPAQARLGDTWFWQHQSDGLALLAAPGEFYSYRLPLVFDERVEVASHFVISPLIPLLTGDGTFYILALAQGGVRLLHCTRYTCEAVELAGVPTSMPEELRYDIFDIMIQHHNSAPDGGGSGIWHGHGGNADTATMKQRLMDFCHHLDNGVRDRLAATQPPLVLAGVEFLRGFYRDASHYHHILSKGIDTSPEQVPDEELHRRAWDFVEPLFTKPCERALEIYRQRAGSGQGRIGNTLETVLPAAQASRVEALFIPHGMQVWGAWHNHGGAVAVHADRQPGDVDLLDRAAALTLKSHGTVHLLPAGMIPDHAALAALYRY